MKRTHSRAEIHNSEADKASASSKAYPIDYWIALVVAIATALLSFCLQRYSLSQLEENYIFLFDPDHISATIDKCGGCSLLIASFCTQFMQWLWVGPLLLGIICGLITLSVSKTVAKLHPQAFTFALPIFIAVFLWLCFENNSFKFQGAVSMCLVLLCLWGYSAITPRWPQLWSGLTALLLMIFLYWAAGSASVLFVAGVFFVELPRGWKRTCYNALLILAYCGCALGAYRAGIVPTLLRAFSPGMYYEWDTTWYMLLYAWIAVGVCFLIAYLTSDSKQDKLRGTQLMLFVLIIVASLGLGVRFYSLVHSASVYRTMQQRYHARHSDWQSIIDMDYDNEKTPFTSYRYLAMAKKGILVENLKTTYPFIGYFMENKTLVKKEDLEMLSDLFYQCQAMGEARRYAFDTNMVTPGAFNPIETLKLAEINIAYGDYKVAEKLITNLEKTLFYADSARALRKCLYNDAEVEKRPTLASLRRAIPKGNSYMSPRGTGRDLQYAADSNPDNLAAREFYRTFLILTTGHE